MRESLTKRIDGAYKMATPDEQFRALMNEVLSGSESAAQALFRDYEPYLLMVIRRRLNKRIRSKFDSLDFAQDVWASFFAEPPEKRSFDGPEELIAFLTTLAQNKVIDAVRHRMKAQKNNVDREQSIDDSTHFDKNNLAGHQATPSQIVMTQEEWKEFLRKQPLVYRRIFTLLSEGKCNADIAHELGIHLRTVERVISGHAPGART